VDRNIAGPKKEEGHDAEEKRREKTSHQEETKSKGPSLTRTKQRGGWTQRGVALVRDVEGESRRRGSWLSQSLEDEKFREVGEEDGKRRRPQWTQEKK